MLRDRPSHRPRTAVSFGVVSAALAAAAVIAVSTGRLRGSTAGDEARQELCRGQVSEPSHKSIAAPDDALLGVWWRFDAGTTGDPLRFYYFHGDGTGLYRYGRVGASYTHSFDYELPDEGSVRIRFRKTGIESTVRFQLELGEGSARDWLTLADDPREAESTRYFRLAEPRGPRLAALGASHGSASTDEPGRAPAGHMWIDLQRYATGGQGFFFYQFRPAGIDGRGVGWFHRGDFDDWSTESLTYRIVQDPPRLELTFDLSGEMEVTNFSLAGLGSDRRLTLHTDPRDFRQTHAYLDAGRSFGSTATERDLDESHPGERDPRFWAVAGLSIGR